MTEEYDPKLKVVHFCQVYLDSGQLITSEYIERVRERVGAPEDARIQTRHMGGTEFIDYTWTRKV